MQLKSYKQLIVWQKSIELVKEIYKLTEGLPKSEMYGLAIQMRRAAISIPSNIAEGYKRRGRQEYIHFLSISEASAAELETQIVIVRELYKNVDCAKAETLLGEIQKMLFSMINKIPKR